MSRDEFRNFVGPKKEGDYRRSGLTRYWTHTGHLQFFKKQKDRFANPIGATISEGLQDLYAVLLEERELGEAAKPLENIIKIRAVQDFTPSQSVAFVYLFKSIVRQELAKEKNREEIWASLSALEARIDKVALMAFDFYMDCRERLHQIRVNEVLSGRSCINRWHEMCLGNAQDKKN